MSESESILPKMTTALQLIRARSFLDSIFDGSGVESGHAAFARISGAGMPAQLRHSRGDDRPAVDSLSNFDGGLAGSHDPVDPLNDGRNPALAISPPQGRVRNWSAVDSFASENQTRRIEK
jgi:hypothetical protein